MFLLVMLEKHKFILKSFVTFFALKWFWFLNMASVDVILHVLFVNHNTTNCTSFLVLVNVNTSDVWFHIFYLFVADFTLGFLVMYPHVLTNIIFEWKFLPTNIAIISFCHVRGFHVCCNSMFKFIYFSTNIAREDFFRTMMLLKMLTNKMSCSENFATKITNKRTTIFQYH